MKTISEQQMAPAAASGLERLAQWRTFADKDWRTFAHKLHVVVQKTWLHCASHQIEEHNVHSTAFISSLLHCNARKVFAHVSCKKKVCKK